MTPLEILRKKKQHKVKVHSVYFQEIYEGKKTFELRYNDREYQDGDILFLQEFNPVLEQYTGRSVLKNIAKVYKELSGLEQDYVILQLI